MATKTVQITFTKTNPESSFFNTTANGIALINSFTTTFGSKFQEATVDNISTYTIDGVTQEQVDDFHKAQHSSFIQLYQYCETNGIQIEFINFSL